MSARAWLGAALVAGLVIAGTTRAPGDEARPKGKAAAPKGPKGQPPQPQKPHPPPHEDLGDLGPRQPPPPPPAAPSYDAFLGTWAVEMTADYSSCDDVKVGDVRKVRWSVALATGKTVKGGAVTLTEKNGAKADAKNYTGDYAADGMTLSLRSGKAAGLELISTSGGSLLIGEQALAGRHVAVKKGTCAVSWQLTATRPTDEPLDVGTSDPDAATWSLAQALAGLAGGGILAADIDTAQGTITCELYPQLAPQAVANFVGLARGLRAWRDPKDGHWWRYRAYYDGLTFHRIIPNFIVQGGDPLSRDASAAGLGTGGPGYTIPDETGNGLRFDVAGRLAMANKGPNTNSGGSQFFITLGRAPSLDGGYTIFGQCTPPEVVQAVAGVAVDGQSGKPKTPELMKVRIYYK